MDTTTYLTLRDDATRALHEARLLDTLQALEGLLSYVGDWSLRRQLTELNEDYALLLDYMKQGVADPAREVQFRQFLHRAYELTEAIHRQFRLRRKQDEGESAIRGYDREGTFFRLEKDGMRPDVVFAFTEETAQARFFDTIWTAPHWHEADEKAASNFMADESRSAEWKALALSAVTLNLLASFDRRQYDWLLSCIIPDNEPLLTARSLIGWVLVTVCRERELSLYPKSVCKARELMAAPWLAPLWTELQKLLLVAQEAPSFAQTMARDILPRLSKMKKDFSIEVLQDLQFRPEENNLSGSEQRELIQAMGDIFAAQAMGVDTTYGTFRQFVGKLPFFRTSAHWFYVFSPSHPEVREVCRHFKIRENDPMLPLCNTARFAWIKAYDFFYEAADAEDKKHIQDWISERQKNESETKELSREQVERVELHKYVLDTFRYFTLFPYRNENENPYKCNLFLPEHTTFARIFSDEKRCEQVVSFCLTLKLWGRALLLSARLPDTLERLLQRARCHRELHQHAEAVECYEKALLIDEDHAEALHSLANEQLLMHRYEDALVTLLRIETTKPDNIVLLMQLARCYTLLHLHDEALERLYQIDYLQPGEHRVLSLQAWNLLCLGRYAEAAPLFDRLIADSPTENDFFNAGHNAWFMNDIATAVTLYVEALHAAGKNYAPVDFFKGDEDTLLALGLTSHDLCVMRDLVNRSL